MDDEDRADLYDRLTAALGWELPPQHWDQLEATLQNLSTSVTDDELRRVRHDLGRIAPRRISRGLQHTLEPPSTQPVPVGVRDLISRLIRQLGDNKDEQRDDHAAK